MTPPAHRLKRNPNTRCDEGGKVHTWCTPSLDTDYRGDLVYVRDCLRCDATQQKRYGATGGWTDRTCQEPTP